MKKFQSKSFRCKNIEYWFEGRILYYRLDGFQWTFSQPLSKNNDVIWKYDYQFYPCHRAVDKETLLKEVKRYFSMMAFH